MGMPKCGSTTVQNTAFNLSKKFREFHGLYYGQLDVAYNNHYSFSSICRSAENSQAAIDYLNRMLRAAIDDSCDSVFVSSEELFYVLEDSKKKRFFENCIAESDFNEDVEFILAHRDFRGFASSYTRQLMANGRFACTPDYMDLGVYVYRLIGEFIRLKGSRTLIRLDNDSHEGNSEGFPSRFFNALGINSTFVIPNAHDNSMIKNSISMDYLGGLLASFDSVIGGLAINGPQMDLVREEIRNRPRSVEVAGFLSRLDIDVFDRIYALVSFMQDKIDQDPDAALLQNQLKDASIIRFP